LIDITPGDRGSSRKPLAPARFPLDLSKAGDGNRKFGTDLFSQCEHKEGVTILRYVVKNSLDKEE
jgi:hypothetical protein